MDKQMASSTRRDGPRTIRGPASLAYCRAVGHDLKSFGKTAAPNSSRKQKRKQTGLSNFSSTSTTRVSRARSKMNQQTSQSIPMENPSDPIGRSVHKKIKRYNRGPPHPGNSRLEESSSSISPASYSSSSSSATSSLSPLLEQINIIVTRCGNVIKRTDGFYFCPNSGCEYKSRKKSSMKDHIRRYSDERPYKCEARECDRSFKIKSGLNRHVREVHGPQRFKCENVGCDRRFRRRDRWTEHMRRCRLRED